MVKSHITQKRGLYKQLPQAEGRREPGPGAGAPSEAGLWPLRVPQVASCQTETHSSGPSGSERDGLLSRSLSPVQAARDAGLLSS